MNTDERCALPEIKSELGIYVREADKGSAVVVIDREHYIDEGYRQLNDTNVYERVDATTIGDVENEIKRLADDLHKDDIINDDMYQHAVREDTHPARFYLLPKVHKKVKVSGRPLISACGSATDVMSEIVDHFLQRFLLNIPSYIEDTDDFIRKKIVL